MGTTQITVHAKDDASDEAKLSNINLGFKSMYGTQKNRFYQIYSTIENNNVRAATITEQIRRLTNITNNLTRIAKNLIMLDRQYYRLKYGSYIKYVQLYNSFRSENPTFYV